MAGNFIFVVSLCVKNDFFSMFPTIFFVYLQIVCLLRYSFGNLWAVWVCNLVAVGSCFLLWMKWCRLNTSENLLLSIQEKIKWADTMGELDKKHRKEIEERVEDVKKTLKVSWMNILYIHFFVIKFRFYLYYFLLCKVTLGSIEKY